MYKYSLFVISQRCWKNSDHVSSFQVLCWGVRNMKKFQLSSVTSPSIEFEVSGNVIQSDMIKNTKRNPNFPNPSYFFDVVSYLPIVRYLFLFKFQCVGLTLKRMVVGLIFGNSCVGRIRQSVGSQLRWLHSLWQNTAFNLSSKQWPLTCNVWVSTGYEKEEHGLDNRPPI